MSLLSIGHESGETGTCAGVFEYNAKKWILSCSHVLAPEGSNVNDKILCPGLKDSESPRIIGRLKGFNRLDDGNFFPNTMDVGIALLIEESYYPELNIHEYSIPIEDTNVMFNGRTSGESTGVILDTNFRWTMELGGNYFGFDSQLKTSCVSKKGDSGALLIDENLRPIGIVIGGSDEGAVVTPIWRIFLNLEEILGE